MIRSLCPYTIVKTSLENLAERKIEHGFSCPSSGKFPGSNGTSEKEVLYFRTECFKRKFVYHLLKPIFDTSVPGFPRRFAGTDLCKCYQRFWNEVLQSCIFLTICPNCEPTGLPMQMIKKYIYIFFCFLLLTLTGPAQPSS